MEGGGGADIDNNADVNQNKTQSKKQTQFEIAREKIRKQMKKPPVKDTPTSPPKSKSKKAKAAFTPLIKAKGKSYKSSLDRNVTEKDPKSQEVLVQKYVKDTKPGGRSKRAWLGRTSFRLGSEGTRRPDRIFNYDDEREEELERMSHGYE